jgi:uncharacterized membrane protein
LPRRKEGSRQDCLLDKSQFLEQTFDGRTLLPAGDGSGLIGFASAFVWQARALPPSELSSYTDLALRWMHIVSGIGWIGLLYFFNLVATPALARLEPPARGKIVAGMMPAALWWFRWSAVLTVLAGFTYWVHLLSRELRRLEGRLDWAALTATVLGWLLVIAAAWTVMFLSLHLPAVTRHGARFGLVFAQLMILVTYAAGWRAVEPTSNRITAIAIGGAYGAFLLLNVWGIVWPAQKRLLAWMKENPGPEASGPPPDELNVALRRAFLVSRASFWLTIPMLFLMAAASHFPLFGN